MSEPEITLPGPPEPSQAQPVRPGEPFWGYADLFLFLAAAVPSLLVAALAAKSVLLLLGRHADNQTPVLLASQFLGYLLWFAFLYGLLRFKYGRPFWSSLGWVGFGEQFAARLMAGVALAFGIAIAGALLRTPDIDMPMKRLLSDPLSIVLIGVTAATIGPVCEEIAFRGFLMPLLVRTLGAPAGILLSSVPFALLHGPQYGWSWRHVLLITAAGAAFGYTRHRTGSTAAAAVVHASYNTTFFLAYVFYGKDLRV
ncbi:MAG: CPBP family intramembrane metalloprotease [Bryobacteraceae bacterium]|nr:CPBP family intramembrane metalloprotease [Bryobacteraceae bacterium]